MNEFDPRPTPQDAPRQAPAPQTPPPAYRQPPAPRAPYPPQGYYAPQRAYPPRGPIPYVRPPKKRMNGGLVALLAVLGSLLFLTLGGLTAFGVTQMIARAQDGGSAHGAAPEDFGDFFDRFDGYDGYGSPDAPYDRGDYLPLPEDDGDDYVAPDIDLTPNEGGLTLHHVPAGEPMEISDVYDKTVPSTVLVLIEGIGNGTGIIATEDGYIITNSHVVSDTRAIEVQVKTNDGELHDAVVVGCDKATDLAVLKIDGTGYTAAEFGDSDELRVGEWVVAIGNPGGEMFPASVTRGIISGLDRAVGSYSESGMTYIQTDAAINPGNSGGPLVNLYGQVVGINSAKIVSEKYEGMGFAIPISGAKRIVDDLLQSGYVSGRVRFGIRGYAVTEYQSVMAGVPQGFLITELDEDSSFTGTDVQPYDIITHINGSETPTMDALSNELLKYSPGDTVEVTLFRPNENTAGGSEFTVTVPLLADEGETQ